MTAEYQRKWRAKNPGKFLLRYANYRKANPEKVKAHAVISYAIRSGKITRQPCVECGNPKSHAHHSDYLSPFKVEWLCALHHKQKHIE